MAAPKMPPRLPALPQKCYRIKVLIRWTVAYDPDRTEQAVSMH